MKVLMDYAAVAGAGAAGAMARLAVGNLCGRLFGPAFPVGTMVINVSGSLFLGWFYAVAGSRLMISESMRLAIAVGFVGAFTTFSTFMYESNALLKDGAMLKAGGNLN